MVDKVITLTMTRADGYEIPAVVALEGYITQAMRAAPGWSLERTVDGRGVIAVDDRGNQMVFDIATIDRRF